MHDQFCAEWYLQTYPDVAAAGMDPFQHYLAHGRAEGRLPRENRARLLAEKLWGGFSEWAAEGLEALLVDDCGRPDEHAYAAWALADWLAFGGHDWRRVAMLAARARSANFPSSIGPLLLESDALRREGRMIESRQRLRRAMSEQAQAVDLQLAYANAWSDGPAARRLEWLNRVLLGGGLATMALRDPGQPLALDNLAVLSAPAIETFSGQKVSVIVPLCNAEATVMTALESLLGQTWRNIEVLVIDDCSRDGSVGLVAERARRDPRVVLLRHPSNLGTYAARNTGLAHATGDFITTHDADDWSHPQKLALQVKALLAAPAAQASVSHWVRCSSSLIFSHQPRQANWVHGNVSSLMFRRQLVQTLGYWDAVTVGADAEFYYRLLTLYGQKAIREVLPGIPLAFGRHHPDSLTQRPESHARSLSYGLRREYQESFDAWHRSTKGAALSPLPAQPPGRLFPVPETMLRQAPVTEVRRIVVADFSADSPQAAALEACLRQLSDFEGQLAVFHLADVTRPVLGRVSDGVRGLMRERGILTLLPGQKVRCSLLFVWTHAGLALPVDEPPALAVLDHCWLLNAHPQGGPPTLPDWIHCAGRIQSCAGGVVQSPAGWAVLESGLFDSAWYLRRYADLAEKRVDSLWHFLAHGLREDRDPGPGFSSSGYRARYLASDADPRVPERAPAVAALLDYLDRGREQGHAPLPMFAGGLAFRAGARTILVCAHLAGPYLFGAEISFLDVLDAFDRLGMNVVVCLPGVHHAAYFARVRQRATQVAVLPYGWWKQGIAPCEPMVMNFRRLMQEARVDLVYLNTVVLDEPIGAAKALKLPVILHVRELPQHDPALCGILGARADEIRERLLTCTDSLVANSQTVRRYLQGSNGCAACPPVDVVPDIVLCPDFDLTLPDEGTPFKVGMISSNLPKKGIADFVELARALASLSPQIRCLLVGPETVTITALRAQQLAGLVPGNVVFRGYAATPQEALSQIHVVVNLSQVEESFGRTVLEAMAARRPVVCYDRGALAELVVDGETGFLVPPGEVTTAAERIHLLSQNPEMRARMGEAARMRAQESFGAAALDAALASVLARFP